MLEIINSFANKLRMLLLNEVSALMLLNQTPIICPDWRGHCETPSQTHSGHLGKEALRIFLNTLHIALMFMEYLKHRWLKKTALAPEKE